MATANHRWRQQACINLIPSEMTASPLVRMLSITDPSFRYAEHRKLKAYYDAEVFYYQGCEFIDEVVMYDMAHVLGLVGPHFQDPFKEGVDLVTGSTHKTFFGTQRGVVASRYEAADERYALWEAIERRTFPGSVSNHHLGTLVGLLMATYEMNHFKDDYQAAVIANAKAFARALNDCGLQVAGDPAVGYTETHQVLVDVGYARGVQIARRLEANNIICNYQAGPEDESFSASGMLRMGVSEMTRFGMGTRGFGKLAQLMRDVVLDKKNVKEEVSRLRQQYLEVEYCFKADAFEDQMKQMMNLIASA